MLLLSFFEIPYVDKLSKNVQKQYVQVIPRSTDQGLFPKEKDNIHTNSFHKMKGSISLEPYVQFHFKFQSFFIT